MKTKLVKNILTSQLFKFLAVAVVSAIFELTLYTFVIEALKIDALPATPIAQIIAMVLNFTLNKSFTFESKSRLNIKEVGGYLLTWLFNLFVTTIVMAFLISKTEIYPTILRFLVMVLLFFLNFIILKRIVFSKK